MSKYVDEWPVIALEDQQLIPDTMDDDCIVQCWFRFLHIIGDPSDLSQPKVISNTPKFLHMALTSDSVIDPHQHRCLQALPEIFHQAMRGLSVLVDAFLGKLLVMSGLSLLVDAFLGKLLVMSGLSLLVDAFLGKLLVMSGLSLLVDAFLGKLLVMSGLSTR